MGLKTNFLKSLRAEITFLIVFSYNFYEKLKKDNGYDDVGLTLATAEAFIQTTGRVDLYSNERCLNGKYFADYQLDYLLQIQKYWRSQGHKFLTFFETIIQHNSNVVTINRIDHVLSTYLQERIFYRRPAQISPPPKKKKSVHINTDVIYLDMT